MYRRSRVQLSSEDMKRRRKVEEKLYEFLGDALVPRFNLKTSVASVYPGTQCVVAGEMDKEQLFSDVDMRLRESLFKICPSQSLFTFKPEVRGTMPKLHMYSVFSLSPYAFKQPKEIVFNFIGSNQVNTSQLKRRKIGESLQREFKTNQYRFSQMWRLQKALKKTRSIKYCYPMHKKSSVDIVAEVRSRRMRWAGHLLRKEDNSLVKNVLVNNPEAEDHRKAQVEMARPDQKDIRKLGRRRRNG
ncbi:hypothetical protein J6590_023552 [Homalodisca vitripennis]|nr:hypothetical protein J6590_023552 [Homalodisca vitripennis]